MDGAIGFSGEKSTGKVILEPMAKNKVEFVTLCNAASNALQVSCHVMMSSRSFWAYYYCFPYLSSIEKVLRLV